MDDSYFISKNHMHNDIWKDFSLQWHLERFLSPSSSGKEVDEIKNTLFYQLLIVQVDSQQFISILDRKTFELYKRKSPNPKIWLVISD